VAETRQQNQHDDDRVMTLVEQTLKIPASERRAYLEQACSGDPELLAQAGSYIDWEERMGAFLKDPLYEITVGEEEFEPVFLPGDKLDGRFRILSEIAAGGMGVVYEAFDEKLERRIAIKCAKAGFHRRLPPEVRNATEISHPNVCKTFEIHTAETPDGDIDFLTMEFLEGETLTARLARGPIPEAEALSIARQIAAGLAAAHKAEVIHGDLKSSNIILTKQAGGGVRAVITDFGLARNSGSELRAAQSGERGGTPTYMAPELLEGSRATRASDIYALGVILRELGSKGRRPLPNWDAVVTQACHSNATKRYPDGAALSKALNPFLTRTRLAIAAAAVLVLGAGAALTYARMTAPLETVRLAVAPFEASPDTTAIVTPLAGATTAVIGSLKGDHKRGLKLTSEGDASHVLRTLFYERGGKVVMQARVVDARSNVLVKAWKAEYGPGKTKYVPVALAGFASWSLGTPPLRVLVSSAGQSDYDLGRTLIRRDSTIEQAVAAFERAVAADPDSALTYAGLAEALYLQNYVNGDPALLDRFAQAEREAELRDPDVAAVHRMRGLLDTRAGQYELAESDYLRAIELDPDEPENQRRLGDLYSITHRDEQAAATLTSAVATHPDNFRLRETLGLYYGDRSKKDDAITHFKIAAQLEPQEFNAHRFLGNVYVDTGHFPEAEQEFRQAVSIRDTPQGEHALGIALMYQGRDPDAIPCFEKALQLDSQRAISWKNLGIARRRAGLDSAQANQQGLQVAQAQVRQNSRNGYMQAILAYLLARTGQRDQALTAVSAALSARPNDDTVRFIVVETYEALNDRQATLDLLSQAPKGLLEDLRRWPDLAELVQNPRFQDLIAAAGLVSGAKAK
jgi:eukaryotic-like serine/threonine-protein kinase